MHLLLPSSLRSRNQSHPYGAHIICLSKITVLVLKQSHMAQFSSVEMATIISRSADYRKIAIEGLGSRSTYNTWVEQN